MCCTHAKVSMRVKDQRAICNRASKTRKPKPKPRPRCLGNKHLADGDGHHGVFHTNKLELSRGGI